MSLARRRQTRVCAAPSATPSSPAISAPEYSYTYFSVNSRLSAGLRASTAARTPSRVRASSGPPLSTRMSSSRGRQARRVRVRRRLSARLRASTHT